MKSFWIYLLLILVTIDLNAKSEFDPKGSKCSFKKFMQQFVISEGKTSEVNSFLVADTAKSPEGEFWVYWPQKREIFLLGWPNDACDNPPIVIRRRLDLTRHIVKTVIDLKGSSYLETEKWASETLLAAARSKFSVDILVKPAK